MPIFFSFADRSASDPAETLLPARIPTKPTVLSAIIPNDSLIRFLLQRLTKKRWPRNVGGDQDVTVAMVESLNPLILTRNSEANLWGVIFFIFRFQSCLLSELLGDRAAPDRLGKPGRRAPVLSGSKFAIQTGYICRQSFIPHIINQLVKHESRFLSVHFLVVCALQQT